MRVYHDLSIAGRPLGMALCQFVLHHRVKRWVATCRTSKGQFPEQKMGDLTQWVGTWKEVVFASWRHLSRAEWSTAASGGRVGESVGQRFTCEAASG